ncbi:hypothetical protein ANN_08300 [Periplaneta americana]|uniref:DUF659 domain-containing protein n=1 Tax=Periplaneta americana TaxID=6978 RepID=A0ABQ8T2M7_PERAM|nr:hypothetical protein ANN_08300 [Periplaneta americana]
MPTCLMRMFSYEIRGERQVEEEATIFVRAAKKISTEDVQVKGTTAGSDGDGGGGGVDGSMPHERPTRQVQVNYEIPTPHGQLRGGGGGGGDGSSGGSDDADEEEEKENDGDDEDTLLNSHISRSEESVEQRKKSLDHWDSNPGFQLYVLALHPQAKPDSSSDARLIPSQVPCAVSSTQKFLVQQHITTSKHQANKQLNSKQRQLFLTQPTTSNVRSEFNIDLCRSLISADIPLYKLKNKVFREFLEKYTQHTIPDESTLRKTYAPSIYDETIQKIRDEIKDSSIWVSIDETPDKEGRLVGNVVIGLLSEQYSERILLHCDVLEKCNNKTIVKLFNEAMGILWPKGIMYDNVLFFISDAAPYMVKAGQALSVVYPKLTHFTCVAHAFHRVAEVVRDNFLK